MDRLIAGCRALEVGDYSIKRGCCHIILLMSLYSLRLDGFQNRIKIFLIAVFGKLVPEL